MRTVKGTTLPKNEGYVKLNLDRKRKMFLTFPFSQKLSASQGLRGLPSIANAHLGVCQKNVSQAKCVSEQTEVGKGFKYFYSLEYYRRPEVDESFQVTSVCMSLPKNEDQAIGVEGNVGTEGVLTFPYFQ